VQFDSVAVEGIWILSNPVTDVLGFALYGEVAVGDRDVELENRLIVHKDLGNWTVAYNLIAETEWEDLISEGEDHVEGVLAHTFGASYGITPAVGVGAELIVESVFPEWSEHEHTTVYLGPVLSYQGRELPGTKWTWWATVTPVMQLTDVEDEPDFQVRIIFGIIF
jgi:hypothetical protein